MSDIPRPPASGAPGHPAKGPILGHVLIEDIAKRRSQQGIEDDDLRDSIRGLLVGDLVRLTLRSDQSPTGETVDVRITAIAEGGYRGTLAARPASKGLADLEAG